MLTCHQCNAAVNKLTVTSINGEPMLLCGTCFSPEPRINTKIQVTLKNGTRIGAAHLDDIQHRRVNPDGSVTRDVGRKYI